MDFGDFIKVGLTIDLKSRVLTHEKNYDKTFNKKTSLFWEAEERYITFIEQHIKSSFPMWNNENYKNTKGYTELFDKEHIEKIKEMINDYFEMLIINHKKGIVHEEILSIVEKLKKKPGPRPRSNTKKIKSFYLDEEIIEFIENLAYEEGVSESAIASRIIKDFMKKQQVEKGAS